MPPSPIRGRTPRQSTSTTPASDNIEHYQNSNNTRQHHPSDTPAIDSTQGGGGLDTSDELDREKVAGVADSNDKSGGNGVENDQKGGESDAIAGLRHALTLVEERASVAEEWRLNEETARRDAEARASALEARVAELEKMLAANHTVQ